MSLLEAELFDEHEQAESLALEFEGLRSVLSEDFADASYEELEDVFAEIVGDMDPDEAEFFGKMLRGIGKAAKSVARIAAPIAKVALPAVGGIFGGPVGAIAGQAGASLLGRLGQKSGRRRPRRRPTRRGRARIARAPRQSRRRRGRGRSRASGRLMGLLNSPQLRQALGSLAAGRNGRRSVRVGRANIPIGSLANLAGTLFAQAAEEAAEYHETSQLPEHLLDEYGEAIEGIEDANFRAELLWEQLVDEGLLEQGLDEQDLEELEYHDEFTEFQGQVLRME